MLLMILLAALAAAAVFVIIRASGHAYVDKIYMSDSKTASRRDRICSEFTQFAVKNNISTTDTDKIAAWSADYRYVTVYLFKGEQLRCSFAAGQVIMPSEAERFELSSYASTHGGLSPVRFRDGTGFITVFDSSETIYYNVANLAAVIISLLLFALIILLYTSSLTRRIVMLSREAEVISSGNFDAPITSSGSDELSRMAAEYDNMRRSVLARMESEHKAWQANSELITALSHDLRTPMTSIIGYLGLLKDNTYSAEDRSAFADAAYRRALDLKTMTDELFRYFLVFGENDVHLELETVDAAMLAEQLFAETAFELADDGFEVTSTVDCPGCQIQVDVMYLKRIFDNLISNLRKYADRAEPLLFTSVIKDGMVCLEVANRIEKNGERKDSNRIGIRTCSRIAELLGGRFETQAEDDRFVARVYLPAVPSQPAD